jgi:predicted O-methyltransferase YrrM
MSGVWLRKYQHCAAQRTAIAHYLHVLFGMVARYPAAQVIELGTDIGESTTALLAAAEITGGHVWSVDANSRCGFLAAFEAIGQGAGPWTFIPGDSTGPAIAAQTPDAADVLFIDSSHLYEQTCRELELYLPKVRPGGTVLLHDTNKPGTADRVKEALDDTLPGFGLTWREYPGENGLGVIEIPRD